MMMIGDRFQQNPTVHQISYYDDPTAHIYSDEFDENFDAFSSDFFRMFEFKVKPCPRPRSHDWTDCPFAHPGEKACRRDPRRCRYSGSACPDFRRGACRFGDACEYAHGVFECWLHPARYRTQPCKDGTRCRRRVCFFAHTPDQLRVLPYGSPDGSPGPESPIRFGSAPNSTDSVSRLAELVRGLNMNELKTGLDYSVRAGTGPPVGFGYQSLPTTPVRAPTRCVGFSDFDLWEMSTEEEEPVMERVESGRKLRERMYAKLGKENSLDRVTG